jgi:hypothetical protein
LVTISGRKFTATVPKGSFKHGFGKEEASVEWNQVSKILFPDSKKQKPSDEPSLTITDTFREIGGAGTLYRHVSHGALARKL